MTIWPKTLFKAKILTQRFITSYKIDPKIYFPAKKVPSKNGTSGIPIYGSYPPEATIYHETSQCSSNFHPLDSF